MIKSMEPWSNTATFTIMNMAFRHKHLRCHGIFVDNTDVIVD